MSNKVKEISKRICVYCGSSNRVSQDYMDMAARLGEILAHNGFGLVYGGARLGMMGAMARSVMQEGGEVIGISPQYLDDKEMAFKDVTEIHIVDSMHVRKQMMVDKSDVFMVMPGGLGTMDEFFEVFTWWQLGLHDKPMIIVNINGYWDFLFKLLDNIAANNFCSPTDIQRLIVVENIEDVAAAINRAPREHNDPKTKWI
jgi:uncharacterized protein (TIGR00730 family)